ncbi:MAG: glycosyltransferase family 2 protein [Bacteroidales bacterium]|jgi:glycosyltransferase involved in cell wall biosynthesis|nr:glycosyltransferase family 2 protein [Bacteroidales bacterium]
MEKIAVLIPCYNESKTIAKVINDFKEVLPGAFIYVYDNNSTDNTDGIAKEAGAIVRYERQQGKGQVIRRMFSEINARCYIIVDGDNTYSVSEAKKMVSLILEENYDMVIGDRLSLTYFTENKRLFHNSGNKLVRNMINFFFNVNLHDIMTGYRAFSPSFVKLFPVISEGFEIETEMTIHALDKHFAIKEIPIHYQDRPEGSFSKLSTYSDGIKVLKTIFTLFKEYRPMKFFSWLALLLFLIAIGLFVPVLIDFLQTGLVPRFPTLIVSVFFALASINSFFSGLILEGIALKEKKFFEIQKNMFLLNYYQGC